MRSQFIACAAAALALVGCSDTGQMTEPAANQDAFPPSLSKGSGNGALVVNGWYEGDEIYYIDQGAEEGVTERGRNQIYVIGDTPRRYQAQVVLFIPGEAGYTPHWNVNLVRTAEGVTVQDIIDAGFASPHFAAEGVVFDDAEDILDAQAAGLVTIFKPGVVVLCPIVSESAADAPGNTEAPEDFEILQPGDSF